MATREELRKRLEDKARPFWYEFNAHNEAGLRTSYENLDLKERDYAAARGDTLDVALKRNLLTEEEITESLQRASIPGLLVMDHENKGKSGPSRKYPGTLRPAVLDYQYTLHWLKMFYEEYGCKRCVMHYFDYPIFDENSMAEPMIARSKVMSTHPAHKINSLSFNLSSYVILGGPITFFPSKIPEVNKIKKEIEKYRRLERRLQNGGSLIPGTFSINEQIKREMSLVSA